MPLMKKIMLSIVAVILQQACNSPIAPSQDATTFSDSVATAIVVDSLPSSQPPPEIEGMVYVEGGTYEMGSADYEKDEQPVHPVTLNSFYIGKYEVTRGKWKEVMGEGKKDLKDPNLPVLYVTWYEAVEFCNILSLQEGLMPCYNIDKEPDTPRVDDWGEGFFYIIEEWLVTIHQEANGYRLPTEAEWEYAARGGQLSKGYLYAGSDTIEQVAWYYEKMKGSIHHVGQKTPNELGLYDMSGNGTEWCWDWKGPYADSAQVNPTGIHNGTQRILRGGSRISLDQGCRSASRNSVFADTKSELITFRLVRQIPIPQSEQ